MKTSGLTLDIVTSQGNAGVSFKGNAQGSMTASKNSFSDIMSQTQGSLNKGKESDKTAFFMDSQSGKKPLDVKSSSSSSDKGNVTAGNTTTAGTANSNVESVTDEVTDVYTEELKDKLKDLLGLSDKEFEDLLEKLGITAADLFNPETLNEFILANFDADSIAEALVNEELSNALLSSSEILSDVVTRLEQEVLADFNGSDLNESFDEILGNSLNGEGHEGETTLTSGEKQIQVEVNKETTNSASDSDAHRDAKDDSLAHENKETFVDYFANKVDLTSIQADGASVYEAKQIVTQLVDQIRLNISQTKTSMEMILNPEALGKVQVVVQNKSGVLTAHLNCENQIAKEALESSLQLLKESFEAQGLKVEKVEVTIGNYTSEYDDQQDQAQEQGKSGSNKKINIDEYLEEEPGTNEKASETPSVHINGTVEYMA